MSSNKLLIHIGYMKAGSTWLQDNIFNNEKAGFFAPWGAQSVEAVEYFIIANSFSFEPELVRQKFESGLKKAEDLTDSP